MGALSLDVWQDPLKFAKQWKHFNAEFITYFASDTFVHKYETAPDLGKLAALSLMQQFVSLFDTSIKTLEASRAVYASPEAQQKLVEHFKTMLDGYFVVLNSWTSLLEKDQKLVKNLLFNKPEKALKAHLNEINQLINACPLTIDQLTASRSFNVDAAALGSQAAWERSIGDKQTLEDFFSLTHQNLLIVLGALTQKTSILTMPTPPLVTFLKDQVAQIKIGRSIASLVGVTFGSNTLTYFYNMPIANHSNTFQILYDLQHKKAGLLVKFLGEPLDRWQFIANGAFLLP